MKNGILSIVIVALVLLAGACSNSDDYIVNPDSSESVDLTDGESPLFASKGGDLVTICHLLPQNPQKTGQTITVGANTTLLVID